MGTCDEWMLVHSLARGDRNKEGEQSTKHSAFFFNTLQMQTRLKRIKEWARATIDVVDGWMDG